MAMENQFVYKFSPPYGDSTIWELAHLSMREFSPPYGDGTKYLAYINARAEFSPPYGDGTEMNAAEKASF